MKNTVVIHGVKYKAVDSKSELIDFTCKDCDIYKAKMPQNMGQLPLCCEDEYKKVNASCCEQFENGIKRIWKQFSRIAPTRLPKAKQKWRLVAIMLHQTIGMTKSLQNKKNLTKM